ncbi:MAG TPA: hypothetical protein GXZ87_09980 [Bacteroidales bacterium]|nr:hypothetical protein [Bacteroidales bacterium]
MITTSPLKKYLLELVIIGLLFVDLFTKSIPIFPLVFCIIVIQFIRLDFVSNIVLSILFIPKIIGSLMNSIGVDRIGGYFTIFGLLLIVFGLFFKKICFLNYKYGLISLIFLLFLFFLSTISTTGGDYAMIKLFSTTVRGVIAFVAFIVLFSNINKVNTNLLGIYLILYSFLLLTLSVDVNQILGPTVLFDFGFMRNQFLEAFSSDLIDTSIISYHLPGYCALQGLSIFLFRKSGIKDSKYLFVLLLVLSLLVILYTGARQTFVVLFALLLIWSFVNYKSKLKSFFISLMVLLIVYFLYTSNEVIFDLFSETVSGGYIEGGGRGVWLLRGIELFLANPYFGVGFGRFSIFGVYGTYPHNIIIELLCEIGLFAFLIILTIIIFFIFKFKNGRNSQYNYIYLLFVYLLSSMVSYGLETNIILFSFIFALPALKTQNTDINKLITYMRK